MLAVSVALLIGTAFLLQNAWPAGAQTTGAQTIYVIKDLGTITNSGGPTDFSFGYDVDNFGRVVGNSAVLTPEGSLGAQHAFLYDGTTTKDMNDLIPAGSGPELQLAEAINDSGRIVGTGRDPSRSYHAFVYENGSAQDLGTLPGGDESRALDVNSSGRVIGYSDSSSSLRAVMWEGGQIQDLGTLPGTSFSLAQGINDLGQVVGFSGDRAFLWENGQMQDLGALGSHPLTAPISRANAVNNSGRVVGVSTTSPSGRTHAFSWENGQMSDLGTLPGHNQSAARDVNGVGQVIGTSTGGVEMRAFLYEDGVMKDLNALIPAGSGWLQLDDAQGINDSGQITGSGYPADNPDVRHAFLMTPIQPETTSQQVNSGGTLSTDTEGDGATDSDPIETSVTSPVAGAVSVTETAARETAPTGFSFLNYQVDITAPASSAGEPIRLDFTLDSSLIPQGQDPNTMEIFRNGARVPDCSDPAAGVASPDPCLTSREVLADGDVGFSVLTSAASAWNIGVAKDGAILDDATDPTGTVVINNRAASTTKSAVKLRLAARDDAGGTGVKEMRFSNDGKRWSAWQPYATSKTWTLASGFGTKTVRAEFRDGAGNVSSPPARDTIKKVRR